MLSNAAGGITWSKMGTIMLIKDQISSLVPSPLAGPNFDNLGTRFPDMSNIYDEHLRDIVKEAAKEGGIDLKEGVYLAVSGPSYETKAEIRAYKLLGADSVGMSTAPETIVSNYLGMKTVAFSLISNMAAGISKHKLNHAEVIEFGRKSGNKLCELVRELIKVL